MEKKSYKKPLILGVLFFLPVFFVLIMSISKENYNTLDIVKENVRELPATNELQIQLKDHLTVLAFFGKKPMEKATEASNLKELIYDKFKGFKKFQIVVLVTEEAKAEAQQLYKEIALYEDLRFWHFVYLKESEINNLFNSLKTNTVLDANLATSNVFIVDTDLSQRGRLDDRTDNEIASNKLVYGLSSYNCIEVDQLKNKMGADDLRVLFTEYREKRKGNFDSSQRRANEINNNEQEN
ncbi:hypothetical protein DMZ43_13245 [Meridianimaribacter sp. CL38]|uniref:hypothetical protein n=1 Tax=Meridianimaribacter sp. CL38 TaxID=2213021 RepID=UPI00103AFFF2|nr:hypothetical protein [Meridianimaribacter sp. CL38]TBV25268.1 hypothetical protein DMZ43_13245 [Meridianimaribacter sp. CL38]